MSQVFNKSDTKLGLMDWILNFKPLFSVKREIHCDKKPVTPSKYNYNMNIFFSFIQKYFEKELRRKNFIKSELSS